MKGFLFLLGLIVGAFVGIFIIIPNVPQCQVFVVEKIFKSNRTNSDRTIILDGETHQFVIQHQKQEAPKLSITDVLLKDVSDERSLELLEPGQEAIIVVTVKNTGGIAKDVKITWFLKQPPKGLRLTPSSEKQISELKKDGIKEYKISVTVENNMKAQEIHLNLHPEESKGSKNNSYSFKLRIKKPLSN